MAPALSLSLRPCSSFVVFASGKNQDSPQPPRITSNVKRNLRLLKLFKEFAKKQSGGNTRPSTSYRKKPVEKQEMPDGADNFVDPTTKLYNTNDGFDFATSVLLVDGYNVCGFWPKLKKHFARGQLETARDKLIHELITFTHVKGLKVVCVFDAAMSGLPTHKECLNSVDIVYVANTDADSWIEREVTLLRADGCPKVWVATSDTFHQHAAHGAGAYVWSCKNLISEINDAKKELQELLHDETMYSTKGKLLEHNLDPEKWLQVLHHLGGSCT
ncbi:uncharacterized protein [Physcomitrium patens]|uniref:NYN domain-containing protein n=1 Tax=Physcomitrium patens TaxID=3218 RepID=A0A7I4EMI4_PHYPA|nr:uncharacterized protein LOC112286664 isoform X2 [Physcomitrium patens]|eukprot:XP_024384541.1 uncharacterized protein LOC112286664 isoform X2 [Physcomitrella patens]